MARETRCLRGYETGAAHVGSSTACFMVGEEKGVRSRFHTRNALLITCRMRERVCERGRVCVRERESERERVCV